MAMAEAALANTTGYTPQRGGTLVDVVDLILDKGLVIDVFLRVSVIGIELVTVDARIVIASVDTYLRFAEAVNRLDLTQTKEATTYEDLLQGGAGKAGESGAKGAIRGAAEELSPRRKLEERRKRKEQEKDEEGEGRDDGEQDDEDDQAEDETTKSREKDDDDDDSKAGLLSKVTRRGKYS